MVHRSWSGEQGGESNERLEFLGDAVLGLVVAEYTFRTWAGLSDGALSKVRASVVNAKTLAEVGADLELGRHLLLGRGEDQAGGRQKPSILADAVEAVIGAVYLDGGLSSARGLILELLGPRIEKAVGAPEASDFKSRLQEDSVHSGRGVPTYVVTRSGPEHDSRYEATVYLSGTDLGRGEGRTKKDAEQMAAQAAWTALEAKEDGDDA